MSKEQITEVRLIPIKDIISEDFQRDVKLKWVKDIIRNFNENEVNEVKVYYDEDKDKYVFINGQHTAKALEAKGEEYVRCYICSNINNKKNAAQLYLDINQRQLPLHSHDKYKAALIAENEDYIEITKIMEKNGVLIVRDVKHDFQTKSIQTLLQLYKKYKTDLPDMINIVIKTWEGDPKSLTGSFLQGFSLFYITYKTDVVWSYFINKFSVISPVKIIRKSKEYDATGASAIAKAIKELYNSIKENKKNQLKS